MTTRYQPIPVPPAGSPSTPPVPRPGGSTTIGPTIVICGELHAMEDITVLGRLDGPVTCEDGAVTVAAGGAITGNVIARDITVHGCVDGQLLATDIVDLRSECAVTGTVIARRLQMHEGAWLQGRVEPQHLEAALRVAQFNRQRHGVIS